MSDRVMIVDDVYAIRETVEIVLEKEGFKVDKAASGMECLDLIKGGFRGLVLMDIMMPRMDGWDTIKAIVDENLLNGNVICMLTAKDDPGPKCQGLEECVLDYITKPFEEERLIEVVKNAVNYI